MVSASVIKHATVTFKLAYPLSPVIKKTLKITDAMTPKKGTQTGKKPGTKPVSYCMVD